MTEPLEPGLYELLITAELEARLATLSEQRETDRDSIHPAEVADRIALHLSRTIERVIETLPSKIRVQQAIEVARALLERIDEQIEDASAASDAPIEPGTVLRSILTRHPDGSSKTIDSPLVPLLDTTLLTNAPGEPRVGRQIATEIDSADSIDLLMAFIRRAGLDPLRESLRKHCDQGRTLRVLTTTYTGTTERRALDMLAALGAKIRLSYDIGRTRLHAKAWLFHRESGFTTGYIGSSNLTSWAQVSGLEWNVRVSGVRNPDVIDKMRAVFESYWESGDFCTYDPDEFDERTCGDRSSQPVLLLSPVEIRPEPFQLRLLEQLTVSRRQGHHRNLLASATGTGKTVMAALDYATLRTRLRRARLLFVAHRREILDQSQATFRHALREPSFGEQWVGGQRPREFEHVFASIQSLSRADLDDLPEDHFDVVIIDEFHHAAASSYDRLLAHLRPQELLGLTATPERADGLPVLHWFGDRIAAELRLWDAIDQHYLTPFAYYGIHDGLDLREVPWRRGRGYDVAGLTNAFTSSDAWARIVIKEVFERAENSDTMRALGFCVSVDHARYMARKFTEAGLEAVAVWADSPDEERQAALKDLAEGRIRVVFSVDLFNEGVDLPLVDTLLLLRPTDSPTLFLQQLGRGLRRANQKALCTVLDFVGHHRREFRFDRRLRALLGGTRKDVEQQVQNGFPFLPAGCHMELDRVAQEIVLESIRSSIPSRWKQKVDELLSLVATGREINLKTYLDHSGLELDDIYAQNRTWSELCDAAKVNTETAGPSEKELRRSIGRLRHVDDDVRLDEYSRLLEQEPIPNAEKLDERNRRIARMLVAQLVDKVVDKSASLQDGINLIWRHPQIRNELLQLFRVLDGSVNHVHIALAGRPEVPLQVHARYSRLEIFAAFGVGSGNNNSDRAKVAPWQTGVRWLPDAKADLFAFTLDKTDGVFSPTTRYRDYAVSPELIHWESQSATRAASETGLRYQEHIAHGSEVLLFARLRQSERAFWFLGPATYVRHEGERPMAITWRLKYPLPGDLFASFAAAVA